MSKLTAEDFFQEVRDRAGSLELNLDQLAALVGISGGTLRSWLSRKSVSKQACAALCRALRWDESPEQLAERYGLKWARHREFSSGVSILQAEPAAGDFLRQVAVQDQKLARLRVSDSVLRYARAMREGDFFAFTSGDREPYESVTEHREPLAQARVSAVANKACFLYIVPRRNQPLVDRVHGFRDWVVGRLVEQEGLRPAQARARAETHLVICPVAGCELWVPGFSFGFHQARDANGVCVQRASIRLPNDFTSEIIHSDGVGQLTRTLMNVVLDTLERSAGRARKKSEREVYQAYMDLVRTNETKSRASLRPGF